jgi:hypothetical protein
MRRDEAFGVRRRRHAGLRRRAIAATLLAVALILSGRAARSQAQLGHKQLGMPWLEAGARAEPEPDLVDPLLSRRSHHPARPLVAAELDDRSGDPDRHTLSIGYVQPVELAWHLKRPDAPPGKLDPTSSTGVGRGQWTNALAEGGIPPLEREREWRVSALADYPPKGERREIDITRGATVQLQGGRLRLWRVLDIGPAGCANRQVTRDRGANLPAVLSHAEERGYGAGPEVDLAIPSLHARVGVRYERALLAGSRPQGQVLILSFAFLEWRGH